MSKQTKLSARHPHEKKPRRGTAAEVRAANLTPWARDILARSLQDWRHILPMSGNIKHNRALRREIIEERRHEAANWGKHFRQWHIRDFEDTDMGIMVRAAARWMGKSEREFIIEALRSSIEAAIDDVYGETGKYELPLTRYEQATFKGEQDDWCEAARVSKALQNLKKADNERTK